MSKMSQAEIYRKTIIPLIPGIVKTLNRMALAGDVHAANSLLNRVMPPLKAHAKSVEVPTSTNLVQQMRNVVDSMLTGKIPPDVGNQLITSLTSLANIELVGDRLNAIEKRLNMVTNQPQTPEEIAQELEKRGLPVDWIQKLDDQFPLNPNYPTIQ